MNVTPGLPGRARDANPRRVVRSMINDGLAGTRRAAAVASEPAATDRHDRPPERRWDR